MDIVPYAAFDQQPAWLKGVNRLIGWMPWIALLVVLVLRFTNGRHFRFGFYFLGTATPLVLLYGWLFLGDSVAGFVHRQRFDADRWRNQGQADHDRMWPPRLCMVDNLMASGRLEGLNSNDVVELLGPPNDKSFPFGARSCDIHYYLGPERGFIRIDSEWLFITFDENGTTDRYWLYRD